MEVHDKVSCISEAKLPANVLLLLQIGWGLQAIQPDLQARVARAQRAQLFNRGSWRRTCCWLSSRACCSSVTLGEDVRDTRGRLP